MYKAILVMDMPKSCNDCRLCNKGTDSFCRATLRTGWDNYIDNLKQKPQWCPLVEKQVKGIKFVERNNGWIPCSERLPNEKERLESYCRNVWGSEFIVMIEGANRPTTLYIKMNEDIWFDDNHDYYNVIAWQPLPEPYEGEQNE